MKKRWNLILLDDIKKYIEASYKHVVYDPYKDQLWVMTDAYRFNGKEVWVDLDSDLGFKRMRVRKISHWFYVCRK